MTLKEKMQQKHRENLEKVSTKALLTLEEWFQKEQELKPLGIEYSIKLKWDSLSGWFSAKNGTLVYCSKEEKDIIFEVLAEELDKEGVKVYEMCRDTCRLTVNCISCNAKKEE